MNNKASWVQLSRRTKFERDGRKYCIIPSYLVCTDLAVPYVRACGGWRYLHTKFAQPGIRRSTRTPRRSLIPGNNTSRYTQHIAASLMFNQECYKDLFYVLYFSIFSIVISSMQQRLWRFAISLMIIRCMHYLIKFNQ